MTTNTDRRELYIAAATNAFNEGFASKAAQKVALGDLTAAFETIRRELMDACLAARTKATGETNSGFEMTPELKAVYWDFPSYPHLLRAKHCAQVRAAFGDRFDALLAVALELASLREAIKAATITPPVKDETKAVAARIVETIRERMDRLNVRYLEAIDLTTVFDDGFVMKGLSANSHYVTNDKGTTFLRTFFYIHGKLTPLNLILAAAQEAKRRADA